MYISILNIVEMRVIWRNKSLIFHKIFCRRQISRHLFSWNIKITDAMIHLKSCKLPGWKHTMFSIYSENPLPSRLSWGPKIHAPSNLLRDNHSCSTLMLSSLRAWCKVWCPLTAFGLWLWEEFLRLSAFCLDVAQFRWSDVIFFHQLLTVCTLLKARTYIHILLKGEYHSLASTSWRYC